MGNHEATRPRIRARKRLKRTTEAEYVTERMVSPKRQLKRLLESSRCRLFTRERITTALITARIPETMERIRFSVIKRRRT